MFHEPTRSLPLDQEHRRLGARMVPFAGWQMPIQYSGIRAEHEAVRRRAGLFDVCHMGELHLRGPRALEVTNTLLTNDVRSIADGRAIYSCCCKESGGVLDDVIAYRRGTDDVLVVCNASNRGKMSGHFDRVARGRCEFEDESDATSLLALQGPRAFAILRAVRSSIDERLPRFAFDSGTVAGVSCTVARTGYTGEDGVELFCAPVDVSRLWSSLLEAGVALGAEPVGLGARDTLRLEAALPLYGNELTEETDPLEAGLSWAVKLDKPEFIGKQALREHHDKGLARRLVGFEMIGRGTARHGYALLGPQGDAVGFCTSGSPSPTLGKSIGLGYVPQALANVGSRLLVDCRGKAIEAVVVPKPFYRRSRGD